MTRQQQTNDEETGGGASRSTDPAAGSSAATDVSLREYLELNWRWQYRFEIERDRRYAEVNVEKEKALKIKETADLAALQLAREIQTYKDEKANELRSQIEAERGNYLSREEYQSQHNALIDKVDTALKPLNDFMISSQGRSSGIGTSVALAYALILIFIAVGSVLLARHTANPVTTVTVTTTTP